MYHMRLTDASHGPGTLANGWKNLVYTIQLTKYNTRAKNTMVTGERQPSVNNNPILPILTRLGKRE